MNHLQTDDYEEELQRAIALSMEKEPLILTNLKPSQSALLNNQGIFSASAKEAQEELQVEIPNSYICSITQEIMKDPVICEDGNSYERSAITDWLTRRQTSPLTNEPMSPNIMIGNRALKEAIEDFQKSNQQNKVSGIK
jgi:hypothetical protein